MSLLGLGFGDCGKGLFTDHLCRRWTAHTVVRFNGGAQAGHNVVLADGRHHTFSQFGAGSFVPGTATVLAYPVVVHPTALLVEDAALRRAGVHDGLDRLRVDARCRVTTPFHQAAGRLREWARGAAAHGSCGVGAGETVRQALADPATALHYGELADTGLALGKLDAIRLALQRAFSEPGFPQGPHGPHDRQGRHGMNGVPEGEAQERALLADPNVAHRWLAAVQPCLDRAPPASPEAIAARLALPGTVLFEGAQGVLLDEWRGFHPHTSWSTVSTAAVEAVLADAGITAPVRHLGVLRSYATRHGAGPLPTADAALDVLAEPHNTGDGWQGRFRRGQPDAVLLRYALRAAGRLDGLLVSHLDAITHMANPMAAVATAGGGLRWCDAYRLGPETTLRSLPWKTTPDLAHQSALTALLGAATPVYEADAVFTPAQWIARAEAVSRLPVLLGAFGPQSEDVQRFAAASWMD